MLWLAVLVLPDGSMVESNLLGLESADTGLADRAYRLRRADGSVTEFSALSSILRHLVDVYGADDLSRATSSHESLRADLAAAAAVGLDATTLKRA